MPRELLAVVGPTCTGKGTLALAWAEALGGPEAVAIVVCDSVKVYRGADVGTAKVTGADRRGFEFHLVDVVDAGEPYNAGRYRDEARAACEAIWRRGKLPLVVGGTGLYFQALLDGLSEVPSAAPAIRADLRARRAAGEDLHAYLSQVDAEAAARISPADGQRLVRALEVFESTGVPLSEIHRRGTCPLATDKTVIVALDAPRPWLEARIEARTHRMFAAGLREETQTLLGRLGRPTAPPLGAIGYRQMVRLLQGTCDEAAAVADVVRETRGLAKRQRTWFRRERRATWLDAAAGAKALREAAQALWEA